MKKLLSLITGNSSSFLTNPGDKIEARVTKSNRQVIKVQKDGGRYKYSATRYQNGTIVETLTTKK